MIRSVWKLALAGLLGTSVPAVAAAQADSAPSDEDKSIPVTPETLGDALSCRSYAAQMAFASALFLENKTPDWMKEAGEEKATKGMLNVYGYTPPERASIIRNPARTGADPCR